MPNRPLRAAFARSPLPYAIALCSLAGSVGVQAQGFIEDSHANLTLRNYYLDRDYQDDGAKSAAREWAQGFILKFQSGFSEGPVGFGLDATGLLGVKLDSSPDRSGTELLPVSPSSGRAADEYSRLGLTGKMKIDKTLLQAGDLNLALPSALSSPSRLLPQTFRGGYLTSSQIDGLTLHGGYVDRIAKRNSTDYEAMTVASPNGRFNGRATTSHMAFVGGDYALSPELTLKAHYLEVTDLYDQGYLGALHKMPVGSGTFSTDVRAFFSGENGSADAGKVDNQHLSLQFAYALGGHRWTLGYAHQGGDTATPYISGTELMGISEMTMSSDYLNARERMWQAIWDYDFAAAGVPGLSARLRYVRGDNIELAAFGVDDRKEREAQWEMGYVIQSGPLRGVGLRVRQSFYRNDFPGGAAFRDENQTRLMATYTLPIW
ncbi:OprD family porin [Pseudomonas sp. C11]|uniref:OprD family porin n=1 Tax=Pseudomonas sp. C11 TaxID=3075550 RepID=UPI002AFF54B4|nr:OprD family porin [Pseudomonas sp. C11]